MIPINQVILGGGDPLLGTSVVGNNLDEQLQLLERYKQNLEAAKQIVAFVGGENNVIRVASCATRLRVVVKDDKKIDVDQIEAMDLVKGTFNNGGQFQVILGTGIVDQVYREFVQVTNIQEVSKEELNKVLNDMIEIYNDVQLVIMDKRYNSSKNSN